MKKYNRRERCVKARMMKFVRRVSCVLFVGRALGLGFVRFVLTTKICPHALRASRITGLLWKRWRTDYVFEAAGSEDNWNEIK